ncbi:hypothetical protein K491DRAFT_758846 [Lophiostoma macrostomum CBS 122681]|uniref:Uncharacterized protein n=1 Tax=Lophiostoma macrostomum CBS 122681 TaxID=1314788 RepID=A0A6A6T5S4_9PLEO|nr:hypothetical protein K491DRAFT_758846 [Lophiostoma macrostomum CBS 122681]
MLPLSKDIFSKRTTESQTTSGIDAPMQVPSSIQYKPYQIWRPHPVIVAVPKNDRERHHGNWCKFKKKLKGKLNIGKKPPHSTQSHEYKLHHGDCKRFDSVEWDFDSGRLETSSTVYIPRYHASSEEKDPSQIPFQLITDDDVTSPDATKSTNNVCSSFDATSPSIVETDATFISFSSNELEVGDSPLRHKPGRNNLSAFYAQGESALPTISSDAVLTRKSDGAKHIETATVAPILHAPLVSTFDDMDPTPLTKAMKSRVWGHEVEHSDPSIYDKGYFTARPDRSKDAAYKISDVLQMKIGYNILSNVVHAASYGNVHCQETLMEVYANCTARSKIYSLKLRRLIRKGYLVLELFCLAEAHLIRWQVANIIRNQLFPSLVGNVEYERKQFTSYIHHSVQVGALPKMSASQTLVLATQDDSDEESAVEQAVFDERELFGREKFIFVHQDGSVDRQIDVRNYNDLFAPEWATCEAQNPNPRNTYVEPKLKKKAGMHFRKDSHSPEKSSRGKITNTSTFR